MPAPHEPARLPPHADAADLPVSEIPPGPPLAPGVLAAVDCSNGSLWALDRAMTEAELLGLPLYVLSVVDPSPGGYTLGMAEIVRDGVARLLHSARDGLRRSVLAVQDARPRPFAGRVSLHVVPGDAIATVLDCSARHHTLVVGARGNGGFARLLLGSVSTAAVHHAACPVLVVPAPAAGSAPAARPANSAVEGRV
ncbi:universal stress protein [Streptacidiphilus sp. ASG 303]|uniref:universal stress protein n=1 Tax=Streptacidiphilus sp. ASG 303 TaxID=2896847 RepID=UPI001E407D47|nr:universal stress protein [Streptacidiphilus sp. ASG 303]MCD0486148.1 universal stress protein [Streptacidiphilus sp. ASG 303]